MLNGFLRNEDGNYAVIVAVTLVPIMTAVGGAVDITTARNMQANVQNALDVSALTIGKEYYSGLSKAELESKGERDFRSNLGQVSALSPSFLYDSGGSSTETLSASSSGDVDLITVRSTFRYDGMFLGFLGPWDVKVKSIVGVTNSTEACILALDPSASDAISLQGSTTVRMDGCVVTANSNSSEAVSRSGSATLAAACVTTTGGTSGLDSSNVDLECGTPRERRPPARDPLAAIEPPSYTGCKGLPKSKEVTLQPGTYCNKTISGDVTLEPGNYILRGGAIDLKGNGRLVGSGVTIFLMEGASMKVTANQFVQLDAPKTGAYSGIVVYQARDNDSTLSLLGGGGSSVTGIVYAAGAHIDYAGNNTMTGNAECLRLIGKTLQMSGNSDVATDCEDELDGKKILVADGVRLME